MKDAAKSLAMRTAEKYGYALPRLQGETVELMQIAVEVGGMCKFRLKGGDAVYGRVVRFNDVMGRVFVMETTAARGRGLSSFLIGDVRKFKFPEVVAELWLKEYKAGGEGR